MDASHANPWSLDQRFGRRHFLRVGGLGLGGLSLPAVLQARQAQAAADRRDTAVILLWMAGGPSHIDTFDPKPQAPERIRGPFSAIPTSVPGFSVCEQLPKTAQVAQHLAVIRSVRHQHAVHDDASHWVQTGYPLLNARERGQQQPAQGAVASCLRGANQPGMPAYVCIPEAYNSRRGFYQSPAYLSARYSALNAGGDPSLGNFRAPEMALPTELTVPRVENRRELLRQVDGFVRNAEAGGVFSSMNDMQQQAFELITGARARSAFDVAQEPAALRERYGRHAWGQSFLLARRLVESGVTFVTVNLYEADVDWWDDHTTVEKNLRKRLPMFDQAYATLVQDLRERGLGDRVLVAAFGEFGRSPFVDDKGGRGHWPAAMSAVLSGGGIREGQVIGSTLPDGSAPQDRPLLPGDLLASIYRVLGIDHEAMIPDRQNRPMRIIETGEPIAELFSQS